MQRKIKSTKLWTSNFICITLLNLLLFCGFQLILSILPIYTKSIGGSDTAVGWISGVATIATVLMRPLAGTALDKISGKIVLVIGLLVIVIVTSAYGWIPMVGMVLTVRFLHGLGWGAASTASSTVASAIIPKQRFGEGMGYFSLSTSFAMAIAPAIGLTLLNILEFKKVSYISAGLTFGALLVSFLLVYPKVELVKKEKKESQKNRSLYEKSSIMPALIMFFITTTYGSIVGFISLYAVANGLKNIGSFFTVYAISLLLIRPFAGKVVDRLGVKFVVFPGLVLLAIALINLSYATSLPLFLFSAVLYGMGFGSLQSSLQTMAITNAPIDRYGAANATFFTGFDGGIGFGSILGGFIASAVGYSRMYLFFSGFAIVAFIIYFVVNRRSPENRIYSQDKEKL